jgi:hypothetical protein
MVLDSDFSFSSNLPSDYDTNLESEWSNLSKFISIQFNRISFVSRLYLDLFSNDNEWGSISIEKSRNKYYQKKLANEITNQMDEMISLLTKGLNIHLNIGQNFVVDSSSISMSLGTVSSQLRRV